jgi:hypothetical protein
MSGRAPAGLVLILLCDGLSVTAQAQYCVQWVRRDDVGSSGARGGHAMAYDSDRHVTVLFGGDVPGSDASTWFNDTWE